MRTVLLTTVLLGMVLPVCLIAVVDGQDPPQPPAAYTSIAEIEAALDEQGESSGGSVQISAPDDFAPEVRMRRRFPSEPNDASVHPARDEIYLVIDGSGTLMTGGTRVDPGDRFSGTRGGETRQIEVGDFVVIPAGTLHWFNQINGSITYVNIRLARP